MSDLEKNKELQARQPVFYITTEKSLVGNEIHEAGAHVAYDGLPAENLKPTCPEGERRYQEYLESNAKRVAHMIESNKESGGLDPQAFMANWAKVQAEMAQEAATTQASAIASAVAVAVAEALAKVFPSGAPVAAAVAPEAPADAKAEAEAKTETSTEPQRRTKG